MVMGVVYWTLMIGFLIGALGKFIFHSMSHGEVFSTMTAGIVGSVLGGWIGNVIGLYDLGDKNGLISSLIGSIIAVSIYYIYFKKTSSKRFFRRTSKHLRSSRTI